MVGIPVLAEHLWCSRGGGGGGSWGRGALRSASLLTALLQRLWIWRQNEKFLCAHIQLRCQASVHTKFLCVCVEILKSNMVVCMQASTKQIETNCVHIYNFTAKCQYRHARLKFQCVCVCWNTEKQHAGLNTGKHQAEFILLWIWRQTVHIRNFIAKHQYRHASDMLYHGSQGLGLQPNKDLISIYKDQD